MCVCLMGSDAPASMQRARVHYGMWLVRRLHVPGDGLAGLRSEVSLPVLWETQRR